MDQLAVDDDLKHPAARCDQFDLRRQFLFQLCRQTDSFIVGSSLNAVFDGDLHHGLLEMVRKFIDKHIIHESVVLNQLKTAQQENSQRG